MADKKITDLNAITTVESADVLPIVDLTDNGTKKVTVDQLATKAQDGVVKTINTTNTPSAAGNVNLNADNIPEAAIGPVNKYATPASVIDSIDNATIANVTPTTADRLIARDASDSNKTKTVTPQSIANLKAVTSTEVIAGITAATLPAITLELSDEIVTRDVSDSNNTKKSTVQDIVDLANPPAPPTIEDEEFKLLADYSNSTEGAWNDVGIQVPIAVAQDEQVFIIANMNYGDTNGVGRHVAWGVTLDSEILPFAIFRDRVVLQGQVAPKNSGVFKFSPPLDAGTRTFKIQKYTSTTSSGNTQFYAEQAGTPDEPGCTLDVLKITPESGAAKITEGTLAANFSGSGTDIPTGLTVDFKTNFDNEKVLLLTNLTMGMGGAGGNPIVNTFYKLDSGPLVPLGLPHLGADNQAVMDSVPVPVTVPISGDHTIQIYITSAQSSRTKTVYGDTVTTINSVPASPSKLQVLVYPEGKFNAATTELAADATVTNDNSWESMSLTHAFTVTENQSTYIVRFDNVVGCGGRDDLYFFGYTLNGGAETPVQRISREGQAQTNNLRSTQNNQVVLKDLTPGVYSMNLIFYIVGTQNLEVYTSTAGSVGTKITSFALNEAPSNLAPGSGSSGITSISGTDSVETTPSPIEDTGTIALVGDAAAPGNDKYYGTDSGGSKGWHDLPAGGGGGGTGSVVDYQTSEIPLGYDLVATGTWEDTGLTVTFDVNATTDVVHLDLFGIAQNTSAANTIRAGYVLDADPIEPLTGITGYTATAEVSLATGFNLTGLSAGSHTVKIQIQAGNADWEIIAASATQPTASLEATVLGEIVGSLGADWKTVSLSANQTLAVNDKIEWDVVDQETVGASDIALNTTTGVFTVQVGTYYMDAGLFPTNSGNDFYYKWRGATTAVPGTEFDLLAPQGGAETSGNERCVNSAVTYKATEETTVWLEATTVSGSPGVHASHSYGNIIKIDTNSAAASGGGGSTLYTSSSWPASSITVNQARNTGVDGLAMAPLSTPIVCNSVVVSGPSDVITVNARCDQGSGSVERYMGFRIDTDTPVVCMYRFNTGDMAWTQQITGIAAGTYTFELVASTSGSFSINQIAFGTPNIFQVKVDAG